MKTIVVTMSITNVIAGAGLLLLFVFSTDQAAPLLALAIALGVQGTYTLALILGVFRSRGHLATRLQIGASTLAFVVGAIGFSIGFATNISSANLDPEFGPMVVAFLFAAHALASFAAFTGSQSTDLRTT